MRLLAISLVAILLVSSLQASSASPSSTATPIKHVVVIMQENHSFDNYFGTYPTANGTLVNAVTSGLASVNGIPNGVCLTYSGTCISPHLSTSDHPDNPVEGQTVYEQDYAPGPNFAQSSGPQSMVYFDYHSIPGYWDYAEEFGLADNYFAAALSMTTPNRLMLLTGDTPVSQNYGPPPLVQFNNTVFGQLSEAGVSWGYYDFLNSSMDPAETYPLNYISGMSRSSENIQDVSALFGELSVGSGFPSVSFVNFLGGHFSLTEHPPNSPAAGEAEVISVVNAVMGSNFWNSTAIFLTWDEGGGFYDHVDPPSSFVLNHNFTSDLHGLGQRIPLLAISPFSKTNYVSHVEMSHLSLLRFIDYNWRLPPLNQLVAGANIPLDFFNFSQAPRPGLILSTSGANGLSYPIPLKPAAPVTAGLFRDPALIIGALLLVSAAIVIAILVGRRKTVRAS